MLRHLALLTLIGLGLIATAQCPAHAQQWLPGGPGGPAICAYNASLPNLPSTGIYSYLQCDIHGQLLVSGGGGGGGLSVTDEAAFTAGTSQFTPSGGQYNSTQQSLTSGQQGTVALSPIRSFYVDTQTTNNNLYAAVTAGAFTDGGTLPSQGVMVGGKDAANLPRTMQIEHCSYPKSTVDIETTTGTGIQVVAGVAATKIYICELDITTSAAANVSLIEGSNSTCSATTAGVFLNPGVTAANGGLLQAGITRGGANSTVAQTATTANTVCVLFTTTNTPQVNVHLAYVQQ